MEGTFKGTIVVNLRDRELAFKISSKSQVAFLVQNYSDLPLFINILKSVTSEFKTKNKDIITSAGASDDVFLSPATTISPTSPATVEYEDDDMISNLFNMYSKNLGLVQSIDDCKIMCL